VVVKSRIRDERQQYTIDGAYPGYSSGSRFLLNERMEDSSATGSIRTDKDPVDKFLADPTNRGDFHRALHEANASFGDVGLAHFRVDRTIVDRPGRDFIIPPPPGTSLLPVVHENWAPRGDWFSSFPSVPAHEHPNGTALRSAGQDLFMSALPNRDQADLGTLLGEIATNPVRALAVPSQQLLKRVAARRPPRGTSRVREAAEERHRRIRDMSIDDARAAADDYLAYIFGVRPTVASLDALAESLTLSRQVAEKVSRQGWKRIRRRRVRPLQREIASTTNPNAVMFAIANGNRAALYGQVHKFTESTQQVWYSASYRMPVSETDHWLDQCSELFKRIDLLTGLGLDVRVAWDLIPFSFMADWFANTGDFLESRQVIADYNITCEYGYVMCHTRLQHTLTASGYWGSYPGSTPRSGGQASYHYSDLTETKERRRAGPFGFNTNWDGLNGFQWSALVALGATYAAGAVPRVRT